MLGGGPMASKTKLEQAAWEALELVYDPELDLDIVNLGLIYEVRTTETDIHVIATLTTMGCPAQDEIEAAMLEELCAIDGVDNIKVEWTFTPPWTPDRLTEF